MNLSEFLESRFVSSQISQGEAATSQNQTPAGVGENQALRALMWLHLFAFTVFYFFATLFKFVAIQCRLAAEPKKARDIATHYFESQSRAQAINQKIAQETIANLSKEPVQPPQSIMKEVH